MARGKYARRNAFAAVLVLATLCGRDPAAMSNGTASDPEVTLRAANVEFAFVRVPAGRFLMGSDTGDGDERPAHEVVLPRDFHVMRTEVTVRQFAAFVEATGYQTDAERGNWAWLCPAADLAGPDRGLNWRTPGLEQSENHPAVVLTRNDAMAFCRWLGAQTGRSVRLPTEAEWEYACRAGTTGHYAGDVTAMGWYRYNSGQRTHPVAQKQPNAWGLYDMHGNVWEWCRDMWHYGYHGAPTDGSAWVEAGFFIPLMRGGSFTNPAWWLRSANHMRNDPGCRHSYNQGFRIVRDL